MSEAKQSDSTAELGGVKCEACGEAPEMASDTAANDTVLWMLICKCGKKGRQPMYGQWSAVAEWEHRGFRAQGAAQPNTEAKGPRSGTA